MKTNQITARALINLIPEELFVELGAEHHVDYQVKKLFGLRIFKLLVYGLLSGKELSPAGFYPVNLTGCFRRWRRIDINWHGHTGRMPGPSPAGCGLPISETRKILLPVVLPNKTTRLYLPKVLT